MSTLKVIGDVMPGLPWEEKPIGCGTALWRHGVNPILGRNPGPSRGRLVVYCGAADTCVALAYGYVLEIMERIKADSLLVPGDPEENRG